MSRVDVLMAVYNGERFVAEQIDSILRQDHRSLHLIIRDDLSSDNTPKILQDFARRYPNQITLLQTHENLGIKGNFSELMRHAQADYIMFSDHDDVWYADKVSKSLKKMKEMEQLHGTQTPLLIHTDLMVVDDQLNTISPSFWNYSKLKPKQAQTLNRLLAQNCVTGCTSMINRTLLTLSNPIPQEAIMHDWWIALTAAAFGKIGWVSLSTMLYRQHVSNSIGAKESGILKEIKKLVLNFDQYVHTSRIIQKRQQRQAAVFLESYHSSLSERQQKTVEGYLKIARGNFLKRVFLIVKHGFFKQGLLRNFKDIIVRQKGYKSNG